MAVKEFTKRFANPVARARILSLAQIEAFRRRASEYPNPRMAGEADPLNGDAPSDAPVPAEHTSPGDVASGEPLDGDDSVLEELRHIDPNLGDGPTGAPEGTARTAAELNRIFGVSVAALHDDVAQSDIQPEGQDDEQIMADGPPGSDEGKPRDALPEADKAQTGDVPSTEQHPVPGQPASGTAAPPGTAGAPPGAPAGAPQAPAAPPPAQHPPAQHAAPGGSQPQAPAQPAAQPPAQSGGQGQPVFDFVEGLDPVDRGKLVNDWQEAVDPKLFSRHTNVFRINQKGNNCILTVQAFNTDSGTQPSVNTGYAVDGVERGELMQHLRQVFQPNGPAVSHVANIYNGFIEAQADLGKMALMRLKVVSSGFQFHPDERTIEGWADGGLGNNPKWQKTPYTVYTVDFTLTFATIGQGQPQGA